MKLFALVAVMATVVTTIVGTSAFAQVPLYQDASQPVKTRVADLLSQMTLVEKVGQMTQIDVTRMMGEDEWDRGH